MSFKPCEIEFRVTDEDIIEKLWQMYVNNQTLDMSHEGMKRLKHSFFSGVFAFIQTLTGMSEFEASLVLVKSVAMETWKFMEDQANYGSSNA